MWNILRCFLFAGYLLGIFLSVSPWDFTFISSYLLLSWHLPWTRNFGLQIYLTELYIKVVLEGVVYYILFKFNTPDHAAQYVLRRLINPLDKHKIRTLSSFHMIRTVIQWDRPIHLAPESNCWGRFSIYKFNRMNHG